MGSKSLMDFGYQEEDGVDCDISSTLVWPPRNKRELIEHARLSYEAHWEQMLLTYPHLRMTPWDDQDAAVREAWIEHITPETWKPGDGYPLPPSKGSTTDSSAGGGRSSVGSTPGPAARPLISRGQMWRHIYGLNHVTVRDFAEYTNGWMVTVTPGVPHDSDKDRSEIPEDEFRNNWKLSS